MSNRKRTRQLGGGFEQEMMDQATVSQPASAPKGASTEKVAERRDTDRNFGGDAMKRNICIAVDEGRKPSTPVWVEAAPEQWKRYQSNIGTDRQVKWDGIVVSAGQRVFAGTLTTSGTKNGKPLVKIDSDELLDSLVSDVLAYRATRPMGRTEAVEALDDLDSTLEHLSQHNRQVNFTPFRERAAAARKEFGDAVLGGDVDVKKLNFREFVEVRVAGIGRDLVATVEDAIDARNQRMAESIGYDISARTEMARANKSSKDRRNALVAIGSDLYAAGGRDPQHPSQQNRSGNQRQGIGNRPDRLRGGQNYGEKMRRHGQRF